jgi:hypothetical protein
MVRLVKGAYWDSEIKRAQVAGLPGYPVYTTKAATDLSYLVCARRLLGAAPHLYGQFATHNAHTLAAVRRWPAGGPAPSSSACTAWARRSTRAAPSATASSPAGLRPGRQPRGPAALSWSAPVGERRQHLLRRRPCSDEKTPIEKSSSIRSPAVEAAGGGPPRARSLSRANLRAAPAQELRRRSRPLHRRRTHPPGRRPHAPGPGGP